MIQQLFAVVLALGVILAAANEPAAAQTPPAAAPPAGTIPTAASLTVTGSAIGPHFLERQLHAALDRLIRPTLAPGASIAYGGLVLAPQSLPPGYITNVYVPVTVSGADLAPAAALMRVSVTNMALDARAPETLFFDDDPEYVAQPGLISSTTVDPDGDRRLYYYHDDAGTPMNVAVVLTAGSPRAGRVQLIGAEAGPNVDVMAVGDSVTQTFLRDEPRNAGIVADVLPGSPFVVRESLTRTGELVAGTLDLRVLSGGPVVASLVAFAPGTDPAAALAAPLLPRDGHHRSGLFDMRAFGTESIAYTVGAPGASYIYGGTDRTLPSVTPDGGHDYGDYGVLHTIAFDVDNPAGVPASVYLYEEPHGGPVRSTFLIGGRLVTLGCARVPQRYLIAAYQIPPAMQSVITVQTTTDGGSNYPLEIGVTQTPPQPDTPPQGAPDGCFPKAATIRSPDRPSAARFAGSDPGGERDDAGQT